MILKGNQRSGACQLATHLMKVEDNEHVDVHELRGFMSDDLHGAFNEIHAISKGTRAKQPLFSLSLNPPPNERVAIEVFEAAIEEIEQKLGLDDQPRAIVFHEKEGRRHAHVVWSRIDCEAMKAINLPHYKLKLKDVARSLFLEHGWNMPAGFINSKDRNPLNFSREEWQQTRRAGFNTKALKRVFQDCWATSDSKQAFAQALLSQGLVLARGDRRGFVAVDYQGEAYSIARYVGARTKDVRERLGDPQELPSFAEAKAQIASGMSARLKQHLEHASSEKQRISAAFEFKRNGLVDRQRGEREKLERAQTERWNAETLERAKRLSHGLKGIWHRLTGKHAKVKRQNEVEALLSLHQNREEKDAMIFSHITQRQQLNIHQNSEQRCHELEIELLRQDIEEYREMGGGNESELKKEFKNAHKKSRKSRTRKREKKSDRGHEPEI